MSPPGAVADAREIKPKNYVAQGRKLASHLDVHAMMSDPMGYPGVQQHYCRLSENAVSDGRRRRLCRPDAGCEMICRTSSAFPA